MSRRSRFPVISGFRVSWDSRRNPGERILGVWLLQEKETSDDNERNESSTPRLIDMEAIKRNDDTRKYKFVTREYLADGHDGYIAFKDKRRLIDHESGNLMSSVVRNYFLGERCSIHLDFHVIDLNIYRLSVHQQDCGFHGSYIV